jgi:hypothetical protein
MHENAYSSIYIFKIFSGGDTPGPPLTRGGEGTGGGEGSGAEGRGRAGERRGGEGGERGRKGEERKEGGEGRRGEEEKKGQGGAFPYFFSFTNRALEMKGDKCSEIFNRFFRIR